MSAFWKLLRDNREYRHLWAGQVVSEVGDHFNTLAVLSLTLHLTGSGLAVGAAMIARTLPMVLAAPLAGVALDRMDRRRIMVASDLARAAVALGFVLVPVYRQVWLIYALSAALMFASPFFTAGRSAVLPSIARDEELRTANAVTQTTAWLTLAVGAMLGGASAARYGYCVAFVANALSFLFSAWAVGRLRGEFRAPLRLGGPKRVTTFRREYAEGLEYIWRTPLVLGVALGWVGWASGGGAAQMLFTLFGEQVFGAGAAGFGLLWGAAGLGLVGGGLLGHRLGGRLGFAQYKNAVSVLLLVHGVAYTACALMPTLLGASVMVGLSRVAMGAVNVVNRNVLLAHVPNALRGRVFATVEMMTNATMMASLALAGVAVDRFPIRTVGMVAGLVSASTTAYWAWANATGRLPEPVPVAPEPHLRHHGA